MSFLHSKNEAKKCKIQNLLDISYPQVVNTSKHLKGRSVPRVSDVFADSKDFVVSLFPDTFRIQEILSFPCFWTLSVFKGFCRFPVSRLFPYSKDFVIFLFPDSFRIQRILSISCFQILSVFKGFCRFPVSRHFPYSRYFVVFLFPDMFPFQKRKNPLTFSISTIVCTIQASRAPQARGQASEVYP